ncbi:hypothetical protein F2P81_002287 [Scophthalmus maximus]|uniref:Uncharacterized protein n=1 Tax=Scophthalmus maximus TaxID=52904 RepID=A0A6A4TN15_SCOMX|nr:hypothetical protein F2P81_002287 [Scophthalmus maximus]
MHLLVRSNYWASAFKSTPPSVKPFVQTRKEGLTQQTRTTITMLTSVSNVSPSVVGNLTSEYLFTITVQNIFSCFPLPIGLRKLQVRVSITESRSSMFDLFEFALSLFQSQNLIRPCLTVLSVLNPGSVAPEPRVRYCYRSTTIFHTTGGPVCSHEHQTFKRANCKVVKGRSRTMDLNIYIAVSLPLRHGTSTQSELLT